MVVRFIRLTVFLISLLPLNLARSLGSCVGLCAWLLKTRGANTTLINLKACFPEKSDRDIQHLARESMKHWGITLCEVPVVWRKGDDSLRWVKGLDGEDIVEKIQSSKNGVILASPHLGNWELMGYWGGKQGSITTLYQPPRRFDLDDLLINAREKTGAMLVPTNAKGVAQLIKALKKGELVGILPDMEPARSSGIFAPFFGVPALTMTLIQSLRARTGALVVFCFAQRVPGGFKLVLIEPDQGIDSESLEESGSSINRAVERLVEMAPEQYQWEYKRFKRRPEGNEKFYS